MIYNLWHIDRSIPWLAYLFKYFWWERFHILLSKANVPQYDIISYLIFAYVIGWKNSNLPWSLSVPSLESLHPIDSTAVIQFQETSHLVYWNEYSYLQTTRTTMPQGRFLKPSRTSTTIVTATGSLSWRSTIQSMPKSAESKGCPLSSTMRMRFRTCLKVIHVPKN